MNIKTFVRTAACAAALATIAACQTVHPSYDYSNFRAHPPRSILVLPPLNESTAIEGTYGYLSTVSEPLAELGYYVFPVAVVDQFLKENGMPTAGEMQQVSLAKVVQITGADAVLYITLKQYGSKYQVINSTTTVEATARLVDTRTGVQLWDGRGFAQQSASNGSGNILGAIVAAAINQAINSKTDHAHKVSRAANVSLFRTEGSALPDGPYSPEYGKVQ
jgi:hypothetical protein